MGEPQVGRPALHRPVEHDRAADALGFEIVRDPIRRAVKRESLAARAQRPDLAGEMARPGGTEACIGVQRAAQRRDRKREDDRGRGRDAVAVVERLLDARFGDEAFLHALKNDRLPVARVANEHHLSPADEME